MTANLTEESEMKTEKPKQDVGWELRKDALARFTEARAEARA